MSAQLEITASPLAALSDAELADEILDDTLVLEMGETGIAPGVAANLRSSRLEACRELLRRWGGQ